MKDKSAQKLGKKGGEATLEKYGKEHFKELSRKAAKLRRERIKRARKKGIHTRKEWEDLKEEFKGRCVRCWKKVDRVVKDHIIPVYQEDSSDGIDNIQPLCSFCNRSKGPERTNWVEIRRKEHRALDKE